MDYQIYNDVSHELVKRYSSNQFNAIFDCIGNQQIYARSAHYLKSDTYTACNVELRSWTLANFARASCQILMNMFWPTTPRLGGTGKKFKLITMMDPGTELMEKMVQLVESGAMRVHVDSVWPAGDALEAYKILVSKRSRGKVLVKWG
jgi:reticulon-4-interacting protein 1, mitochondrial